MPYTDPDQLMRDSIAALRSGRYPQDIGHLRGLKGYCCLGVISDTYDPTKWGDDNFYRLGPGDDDQSNVALPLPLARFLFDDSSIEMHDPYIEIAIPIEYVRKHIRAEIITQITAKHRCSKTISLSTLNDNDATFGEIANLLEDWWFNAPREAPDA